MKQRLLFCQDCKTNYQWTEAPPTVPGFYWTIYPSQGSTPVMHRVEPVATLINHDKPKSKQYWQVELVVHDWNGHEMSVELISEIKRGPWGGVLWSERIEEPEIPNIVKERRENARNEWGLD